MKAVILAGGFGKRLKPLTDTVPKPMVSIAGRPIIEWQIRWLKEYGIDQFVICVGYRKEAIINHIASGSKLGVNVGYAVEDIPLGTGGAIKNAYSLIGTKDFLVVNGDILTNLDPTKLTRKNNAYSISLVPMRSQFDTVEVENGDGEDGDYSESTVKGFSEKPVIADLWINAGVYFFNNEIFDYLPDSGNIENTTLPALANSKCLRAIKFSSVSWRSIDSHKDIEEASKEVSIMYPLIASR